MKDIPNLQIFTITDLHIGNGLIPSKDTLQYTKSYIMDEIKNIQQSDIFLITGDMVDKLLYTNSIEYGHLMELVHYICSVCDKLNLTLIYIEGTPLHEMGQMSNVHKEMVRSYPKLDFRYHDELGLYEFNKDGGVMTYITVPDQMASTDDELYSKVTSLIRSAKLPKVDFIFSHTEYEEALKYPTVGVKSTALWSNLVNYYVVNGHIHYHSVRDSIITTGALNFMTHGDEEVKGGVVIKIKNFVKNYAFIPTKHFTKFKTLNIVGNNYLPVIESIRKLFEFENNIYYIRVIGDLPQESITILKKEKPLMRLKTVRVKENEVKKIEEGKVVKTTFKELSITPNNIETLIKEELGEHFTGEVIMTLREVGNQLNYKC